MPALVLPAIEVVRATPRTRIIRLSLEQAAFSFTAGQAVMVGLHEGTIRKPYSLALSPGQAVATQSLELLAQVEETDALDPHLERVLPGTLVDVEGPFGEFRLPQPLIAPELLFAAGGTGIAPLRSMLWEVLERGEPARITVFYSARTVDELAYLDELQALTHDGRLDLLLTVTREPVSAWSGRRGRIDARLVTQLLRTPDTQCQVCGPPAFVAEAIRLLEKAGVPSTLIASEGYGT